jgi:hypothetical protein
MGCRAAASVSVVDGRVMVRGSPFRLVSLSRPYPCFLLTVAIVNRLVAEKRRLESEEEAAEESLLQLQRDLNERIARLTRLRKQKKALVTRGHEMISRGMRSLDELEAAEKDEAEAVIGVQAMGGFGVVDWNAVGALDDFLTSDPGAAGGTVATTAGSSSSV